MPWGGKKDDTDDKDKVYNYEVYDDDGDEDDGYDVVDYDDLDDESQTTVDFLELSRGAKEKVKNFATNFLQQYLLELQGGLGDQGLGVAGGLGHLDFGILRSLKKKSLKKKGPRSAMKHLIRKLKRKLRDKKREIKVLVRGDERFRRSSREKAPLPREIKRLLRTKREEEIVRKRKNRRGIKNAVRRGIRSAVRRLVRRSGGLKAHKGLRVKTYKPSVKTCKPILLNEEKRRIFITVILFFLRAF